ncbi:methionine--tRNA ligase, mitochondrial [Dendroctonus ponderosae]|uniref:methionine--tRNA ligase, mitochondrial n=1 Tax=Dendroctonus ponderosae TaxID=77166 RepID=UPI00203610E4|nr:methionine--tRNA ligase, mitochondrial [Dendroctonus ponderosae]
MGLGILQFARKYSSTKCVTYFTTPIYYVNAEPHIGHLYSSVIADASKRWTQILHRDAKVMLSTGTDEHGTKIQRAAKVHQTTLSGYCDKISSQYRKLSDEFNVDYTDFIRTTQDRHKETVQNFWNVLAEKGLIYKSTYQGWYCVPDETFLSDSQLNEVERDGQKLLVSAESGHPVEWSEEPNYIFRLSAFKDDLIYWLKKNEKAVVPHKFHKILLDIIHSDNALDDISVSRPSSRVHWGIPVPNDPDQTVYVWLDALVNYLTVAGYSQNPTDKFPQVWPPDVQVIGKDILKFHGVYWPAFLMAAGLEPPRCLLCHSHWTVDSEKMSKSKGNVVNPMEKSDVFTADGLRYFLLREGVNHSDGNYGNKKVIQLLNAELADTLGNLLSRCCGKALNPDQVFPKMHPQSFSKISSMQATSILLKNVELLPTVCQQHYSDFNFYKAADAVIAALHAANVFFDTLKPWELRKSDSTIDELHVVLHLCFETLRTAGILLQPLMPNISDSVLNKLNVPRSDRFFDNLQQFSWQDERFQTRPLGAEGSILFKRILLDVAKNKAASHK